MNRLLRDGSCLVPGVTGLFVEWPVVAPDGGVGALEFIMPPPMVLTVVSVASKDHLHQMDGAVKGYSNLPIGEFLGVDGCQEPLVVFCFLPVVRLSRHRPEASQQERDRGSSLQADTPATEAHQRGNSDIRGPAQ